MIGLLKLFIVLGYNSGNNPIKQLFFEKRVEGLVSVLKNIKDLDKKDIKIVFSGLGVPTETISEAKKMNLYLKSFLNSNYSQFFSKETIAKISENTIIEEKSTVTNDNMVFILQLILEPYFHYQEKNNKKEFTLTIDPYIFTNYFHTARSHLILAKVVEQMAKTCKENFNLILKLSNEFLHHEVKFIQDFRLKPDYIFSWYSQLKNDQTFVYIKGNDFVKEYVTYYSNYYQQHSYFIPNSSLNKSTVSEIATCFNFVYYEFEKEYNKNRSYYCVGINKFKLTDIDHANENERIFGVALNPLDEHPFILDDKNLDSDSLKNLSKSILNIRELEDKVKQVECLESPLEEIIMLGIENSFDKIRNGYENIGKVLEQASNKLI